MFWLILAVLCIAGAIILADTTDGGSCMLIIPACICLMPVIIGACTYPMLCASKAEVLALKSEIVTVQNAHYTEVQGGTLIGGSLDNMQQASTLSTYIIGYAKKKASYNMTLAGDKIRRRMKLGYWFLDSAFISKEIDTLDPL